jgi:hypothetical protein
VARQLHIKILETNWIDPCESQREITAEIPSDDEMRIDIFSMAPFNMCSNWSFSNEAAIGRKQELQWTAPDGRNKDCVSADA